VLVSSSLEYFDVGNFVERLLEHPAHHQEGLHLLQLLLVSLEMLTPVANILCPYSCSGTIVATLLLTPAMQGQIKVKSYKHCGSDGPAQVCFRGYWIRLD
jgi:hypothetical protein